LEIENSEPKRNLEDIPDQVDLGKLVEVKIYECIHCKKEYKSYNGVYSHFKRRHINEAVPKHNQFKLINQNVSKNSNPHNKGNSTVGNAVKIEN
jgi:hypothetical protein